MCVQCFKNVTMSLFLYRFFFLYFVGEDTLKTSLYNQTNQFILKKNIRQMGVYSPLYQQKEANLRNLLHGHKSSPLVLKKVISGAIESHPFDKTINIPL